MSGASINELLRCRASGRQRPARLRRLLSWGDGAWHARSGLVQFRSSRDVAQYYMPLLAGLKREQFQVVLLDQKNKIIKDVMVSQGSLTASVVHPREVFNFAIRDSAAAIICVHNHPSGDPQPSREDRALTTRLGEAGRLLGIQVLDHIIVGRHLHEFCR